MSDNNDERWLIAEMEKELADPTVSEQRKELLRALLDFGAKLGGLEGRVGEMLSESRSGDEWKGAL